MRKLRRRLGLHKAPELGQQEGLPHPPPGEEMLMEEGERQVKGPITRHYAKHKANGQMLIRWTCRVCRTFNPEQPYRYALGGGSSLKVEQFACLL
jgi:hypothetical protein